MKNLSISVLLVMSVSLIAACTGQGRTSAQSETLEQRLAVMGYIGRTEVKSINNYKLNGWNVVNKQAIVIKSSPKQHYLLTFARRCQDLSTTEALRIDSSTNVVTRFDKIVVGPSGMHNHCPIDRIYELRR